MRRVVGATLGILACLWPAAGAAISEPRLVADLATVPSPRSGSEPAEFVEVGSYVLFTARPGDHARRLYRSNGTPEGTQELADGCAPLQEGGFGLSFATAARAFYAVSCGSAGQALWASDGTPGGTRAILATGSYHRPAPWIRAPQWAEDGDIVLFLQGGNYDLPLELWRTDGTASGTARIAVVSQTDQVTGALHRRGAGDLLLVVEEASDRFVVWQSDGTAAGTQPVETLTYPDQHPRLRSFAATADGIAFAISVWPPSRVELWYSDGTAEGTRLGVELPYEVVEGLAAHAGSVYFIAEVDGSEWVWRGDGTAETTRAIVPLGSRSATAESFEFFDGHLFLVACADDQLSCTLLRAPLGGGLAEEVAEVCDTPSCHWTRDELWVRGVGTRLIYSRRRATAVEVWTSAADGSGAAAVATLCPPDSCFVPDVGPVVLGTRLFFATANDGAGERELWSSDGTAGGTVRHAGPLPVIGWYETRVAPLPLAAVPGGDAWIFAAGDSLHGLELWRARAQADSGALVEDLRLDRPGLFNPEPVGTVDATLIFARIGDDGTERTLYRHAVGEAAVEPFLTVPVRRGRHGSRNAPPSLRPAGNAWFFIENDLGDENPFAKQIWRYDPVSRDLRTLFADDPQVTGIGARADDLVPSGADFLFLGSIDPELHPAIYRLKPRSGAISKLMDLPAEYATSIGHTGDRWFLLEDSQRMVAIDLVQRTRVVLDDFPFGYIDQATALEGGVLFAVDFGVYGSAAGVELRQSDGAAPGTQRIAQWSPSAGGCGWHLGLPAKGSASPALLTAQVYCTAAASELWVSDGSVERTRLLRAFPQEELAISPASRSTRGELYFLTSRQVADQGPMTSAIWKTDGMPAGTREVAALPSFQSGSWNWRDGAQGGDAFYFAWSDPEHGLELWRTDGTYAGTGLVADLEPGQAGSSPWQLRTVGDQVIFRAGTAASGLELWQVDGGVLSPQLVADLYPGIESSGPLMLDATDEALFFSADDGVVGREIWEVDRPSVAPCVADATTLCLADGRFRARAVRRDFVGELGAAGVVPLTGDSGYFWFFAPGNPEVLLKVVDACGLPGFENFWAYSTGLTNVEVELEVVDTVTGERREVRTALGETFGPLYDSGSFEVCNFGGASAGGHREPVRAAADEASSGSSATVLPLLDGRFAATATWRKRDGTTGAATAVPFAADSGYFWFFDAAIVEVLVKMVDACGSDGFDNFWVFAGGLTDVEVHLTVTDTWSGEVVRHDTRQGQPYPTLLETGKLRVCAGAP